MPYDIVTSMLNMPCARKTAEMMAYSAAIPLIAFSMMAAFTALGAGTTKAWFASTPRMF